MADESIAQCLEGAIDGFSMTFQARFAPAGQTILVLDPNEQPAGWDVEGLDPSNLHATSALRAEFAGRGLGLDMTEQLGRVLALVARSLASGA
jgi:hypothetical protein